MTFTLWHKCIEKGRGGDCEEKDHLDNQKPSSSPPQKQINISESQLRYSLCFLKYVQPFKETLLNHEEDLIRPQKAA
jgi:hypothetical protein